MKKISISILLVHICFFLNAQIPINLEGVDSKGKKIENIEFLIDYYGDKSNNETIYSFLKTRYVVDGKQEEGSVSKLKSFTFKLNSLKDFWQNQAIQKGVYENIAKKGPQYDLRQDIEIDILNYLNDLDKNNLLYKDQYLENYLYSLVYRIYPGIIVDGKPGVININIIKDQRPNASMAPNGTLIINTGLITTINSEEELVGIIAHEVSHFVLDHSIININKAEKRQRAAEFWAAFATGLAAASEVYMASQNEYYVPGAITYSTAVLSYSIASQISERMGLKYSKEQEIEADNCAAELMKFINVDPTALSSALIKIREYCLVTGNYLALTGEGTHPSINDRVKNLGYSKSFSSLSYDKIFSNVNSLNAIYEYNNKHFIKCQEIIDRNIKSGVPTEDDYILKAMTNLCLYDNVEKNNEALESINKAKSLNVSPSINLFKQESLIYIRLNKKEDAIKSLEEYSTIINREISKLEQTKSELVWSSFKDYFDSEMEWTAKMIYKVKNL